MIERGELRPGNWVRVRVSGKDGELDFNSQIKQILPNDVILANGLRAAFRMLYPIQLTDDILLKSPDVSIDPNTFITLADTPSEETIYFLGGIN